MSNFFRSNINNINTALVLVSFGFAIIIPFELFLFSYAILGPIHYLSEIAWLDKKNFFLKSSNRIDFLNLLRGRNIMLPELFHKNIFFIFWSYFCGFNI